MLSEYSGDRSTPHILIVDDEPAICFTLQCALEHYGYAVAAASNGAEAHARITRASFDMLLIDPRLAGRISASDLIYDAEICQPPAAILLLVGTLDFALPPARANLNRFATLAKAASPPAIATAVAIALAQRERWPEKAHSA